MALCTPESHMLEIKNQSEVIRILSEEMPRVVQWATARTLTGLAYKARDQIPGVIASEMTLRKKSFVTKQTWVIAANGRVPVYGQRAYFGTRDVGLSDATQWIEQPVGGVDRRKRRWSKSVRRGGKAQVPQKLRFKSSRKVLHISSKKGQRLWEIEKILSESNDFNRPVMIHAGNKDNLYPQIVRFLKRKIRGTRHYRLKHVASVESDDVRKVDILGIAYSRVASEREWLFVNNFIAQIRRIKF